MSRFLAQSKTFLPMVIQKSTRDALQILEKYPALSTAQHEELPKQGLQNEETPKQATLKQELTKQDQPKLEPVREEILKQISTAPTENLKIVLHKSPIMELSKVQEVRKDPITTKNVESLKVVAKNVESLKVVAKNVESLKDVAKNVESLKVVEAVPEQQKNLLRAVLLDLIQVKQMLVVLLTDRRVRLWLQELTIRAGLRPSHVLRMEQPQLKEKEPHLLIMPHKKTDSETKQDKKSEEKPPMKSNMMEYIEQNSSLWQESISDKLGQLQKVVQEKASK